MSRSILVIGESGSGKSRSMKNLDPATTFLISVAEKDLPFRSKGYTKASSQKKTGNVVISDDYSIVKTVMAHVHQDRPEIKTLVIDDAQYLMVNEFMRRAQENGYAKFTEIGLHFWELVKTSTMLRQDLTVIFMGHSERDENGIGKFKTIGKLLDDKITIEGMFTFVFLCCIKDGKHVFVVNSDGSNRAKSPEDMFESVEIENDLQLVLTALTNYYDKE